jgi:hypothetical protein
MLGKGRLQVIEQRLAVVAPQIWRGEAGIAALVRVS